MAKLLLLLTVVCTLNVHANTSDTSTCIFDDQMSGNETSPFVVNSLSEADLNCSAECNTVRCVFEFPDDQLVFSLELNPSDSDSGDIRIKATTEDFVGELISIPQHLLFFKADQSRQRRSDQSEVNKDNAKANGNNMNQSEKSADKKYAFPWTALFTVHTELSGSTYLLISVGKTKPSSSIDSLVFDAVSGYRIRVTQDTKGINCHTDQRGFSECSSSNPNHQSTQFSHTGLIHGAHVTVDQRDACVNDSVFAMVYVTNMDSEKDMNRILKQAIIFLFNFKALQHSTALMQIAPRDDSSDVVANAELHWVINSAVHSKISDDGKNLIILWQSLSTDLTTILFVTNMSLPTCESEQIDALWEEESADMDPDDNRNHAVCQSFRHALHTSSLRRGHLKQGEPMKDGRNVTINCIATGCTEAMCTVEVKDKNSPRNNYMLIIEFEIPICHMQAIFYKVYELRDGKRVHVTSDVIGTSYQDNARQRTESGDQTYSISGAVYNHAISDSDDPGLLHNLYFDAAYLCGPMGDALSEEEEERVAMGIIPEGYTEYLLKRRCFHFHSTSYPLIMMVSRYSICDVSNSTSQDQCDDIKSSLTPLNQDSSWTRSLTRGGFFFTQVGLESSLYSLSYSCDITENCDGLNCLYVVMHHKKHCDPCYDPYSIHPDEVPPQLKVVSRTAIQYRNEHCSQYSSGLIITSESIYHTNRDYLSLANEHIQSDPSPQFDYRVLYPDKLMDRTAGLMPTIFVPVIYPNGTTVVTQMRVGPNTRLMDIKESDGRMLLSIYLNYDSRASFLQMKDVNLGSTACENQQSTLSQTCQEWKDAAAKFELFPSISCSPDLSCSGINCRGRSNSYHVQFGSCFGFKVFVTKLSADGGDDDQKAKIYEKGSFIPELGNAYLRDYVMYRDCVVVIFTPSATSTIYKKSVFPRSCPNGSMEEKLQDCLSELKEVLLNDTKKLNFTYIPESDVAEPSKQSEHSTNSSNWKPLLLGFVLTTSFIVLMTSLSILMCRKRGVGLKRPNNRLRTLRLDFSRGIRHQPLAESSTVLYRDDEDDLPLSREAALDRKHEMREMHYFD